VVQLPDGKIFSTEHSGPATHDEINRIELGWNYGWPAMQGYNNCTSMVPDSCNSAYFLAHHKSPVYSGTLTPAGLDYYNHPAIPEWSNCLIVGTLYQPDSCLAVFSLSSDHDSILNRRNYLKKYGNGINSFQRTRDICAAPDGSIYCLVLDRKFTSVGDSLINLGTKILRLRNDAYIPSAVSSLAPRETLKLYPNPTSDQLHLEYPGFTRPVSYRIMDASGRTVSEGQLVAPHTLFSARNWPAGSYEFVLMEQQIVTAKFVVAH
jgi:hypothetical protein